MEMPSAEFAHAVVPSTSVPILLPLIALFIAAAQAIDTPWPLLPEMTLLEIVLPEASDKETPSPPFPRATSPSTSVPILLLVMEAFCAIRAGQRDTVSAVGGDHVARHRGVGCVDDGHTVP